MALCIECKVRPNYPGHPYCGKTCASKAKAKAVSSNCIHCHVRPKNGGHPYCSRACASAAAASNNALVAYAHNFVSAPGSATSNCIHCHVRPKNDGHPYCSRTCAAAAAASATNVVAHASSLTHSPTSGAATCIQCHVRPTYDGHPYCGRTCAAAAAAAIGASSQVPYAATSSSVSSPPNRSDLCNVCQQWPKIPSKSYCSKKCAKAARSMKPYAGLSSIVSKSSSEGVTSLFRWPMYAIRSTQTSAPSGVPRQILFYDQDQPYYGFTNFSPHPVIYKSKRYPTSEHLFQAFKFLGYNRDIAEHIRTISERPRDALEEARRCQQHVRPDWFQVNIKMMGKALKLKFKQHKDLRRELLGTGDAELIEDSKVDSFWGIGADGKGRNELGKALMKLREQLRKK